MEILEGILERVTYYSSETSYLVGRLKGEGRGSVTFVGYFPSLQEGESLRLKGEWKVHPRYGKQFQVKEWESITPTTSKGLERFLASGLIKGVGPHTARLLLKHFGLNVLKIIENDPRRLLEIPGIGPKKAALIQHSYQQHREIKEVMIFLQEHGVSPSLAVRLFKHYGSRAIPLVKENPYRLAEEVFGVGFLTADKIARKLGLPFNSPLRVRAAILFLLNRAADEGHVFLPLREIKAKVIELLYSQLDSEEVPAGVEKDKGTKKGSEARMEMNSKSMRPHVFVAGSENIAQGLAGEEIEQELVSSQLEELKGQRLVFCRENGAGEENVYAAPFYYAEKGSADRLLALASRQRDIFDSGIEGVIQDILQEEKIRLAPEQVEAIKGVCQNGVMVITGGPGTGKTTTIRVLIKLFRRYGLKVVLAAPTGRAAKRMTEATGLEAKTVHRLLEYTYVEGTGFRFLRGENNPIRAQVVIVDEVSMIDLLLFYSLLKAIPPGCRLVLVGDADQLPSVGPGNVLNDIIASGVIPCVRLNTIFRQARESMIVVNAHRINRGEMPILNQKHKDFFFISEEDPERVARIIVELCRDRLPRFGAFDPLEEIQVLTPMRRTQVGVERLNYLLQQELNPPARHKKELTVGGVVFRLGDKVMQIRNNYEKEVFNGDMGRITDIDLDEGEIIVSFPDIYSTREVTYDLLELDELVHSYAISVHKSQGSEYPVVVMPVITQHYILLQRNLLYTGITRAKKAVVLVGSRRAVAIAVNNNRVEKRYSSLDKLIKGLDRRG